MATQTRLDPEPDPRASAYLDALRLPPSAGHVAELTRRGIPIPASQAVASALLTDAIRREVRGDNAH